MSVDFEVPVTESLVQQQLRRPEAPRSPFEPLPQPRENVPPVELVQLCYTMVHAAQAVGIVDLADGEYRPGDTTLEQGIERQLNYLLDQVGCTRPGFRLLEIGCGYGRLLDLARDRGAIVAGINVSPEQVAYCRRRGHAAYCTTYRNLLDSPEWHGQFDGVIANGSLEHWVQPEDVLAGRAKDIYTESFAIARRCLDPHAQDGRYVTTAIHVKRPVKAEDMLTPWQEHPKGSNERHFSLLHNWMGGWYPVDGQLAECAWPHFELVDEQDGTQGYKIANDYRLKRMMRGWLTSPRMVGRIARMMVRHPRVWRTMMHSFFIEQSWDWQFRGDDPPMKLLRQTWRRMA